MQIMVVDDEMIIRESFFYWFQKEGHSVVTVASAYEALERLNQDAFDLLFVDIRMPGMDGLQLLEVVKKEYPEVLIVIITAHGTIETAVKAMKMGAEDYLLKPFAPDQLQLVMGKIDQRRKLAAECNYLRGELGKLTRFENIIGQSEGMRQIFSLIPEVAQSDASILLIGETGTGKELVAKAIHAKSRRKNFPFVAINCGAIPDSLLESELFGHQKGAYTGAVQSCKGYLEIAGGGTLFLDEIGEISPKMQVDLLRVLEERVLTRIGSRDAVNVDFRLISATSRDLNESINKDRFRKDFYYRINVIKIEIPPLRERKDDIALLAHHFMRKYSRETNKRVDNISPEALRLLTAYDWPGNVRELGNAIERAVVLSKTRTLQYEAFNFLKDPTAPERPQNGSLTLQENEKAYIRQILNNSGWNVTHAAEILGINRTTLHKKIKRYQLK